MCHSSQQLMMYWKGGEDGGCCETGTCPSGPGSSAGGITNSFSQHLTATCPHRGLGPADAELRVWWEGGHIKVAFKVICMVLKVGCILSHRKPANTAQCGFYTSDVHNNRKDPQRRSEGTVLPLAPRRTKPKPSFSFFWSTTVFSSTTQSLWRRWRAERPLAQPIIRSMATDARAEWRFMSVRQGQGRAG